MSQLIAIEVDNPSRFKITFIQIDADGEHAKVKLENEDEHRVLTRNSHGQAALQITWQSAKRRHELGL
jgi:hypothetical protein